jgi:hypothetical protein
MAGTDRSVKATVVKYCVMRAVLDAATHSVGRRRQTLTMAKRRKFIIAEEHDQRPLEQIEEIADPGQIQISPSPTMSAFLRSAPDSLSLPP